MAVDWTQVLVALAVGLPATLTAAGAIYTSLRAGRKIDENTTITRQGAADAVVNAKSAASAASLAAKKADQLTHQMNGALDERIRTIVKEHLEPLVTAFAQHNEQDNEHMREIRQALTDLKNAKEPERP